MHRGQVVVEWDDIIRLWHSYRHAEVVASWLMTNQAHVQILIQDMLLQII
jgi:hypothetical protein